MTTKVSGQEQGLAAAHGPSLPMSATVDVAEKDRVSALGQKAMQTYWRDLPELMKSHYRQWVAYHGDRQLGISKDSCELYQDCLRQGFGPDEFLIRSIEEELPGLVLGNPPPEEWPDESMEM